MRVIRLLLVAFVVGPAGSSAGPPREATTGPIAVSGGAELDQILVERRRAARAAREADLTYMRLDLWLPAKWQGEAEHYLVRLLDLKPVEDDTGQVLSSAKRLESIDYLRREVRVGHRKGGDGVDGPVIGVALDAPARRAETLKALRGKAEVTRAIAVRLRFTGVGAMCGGPVEHPKLKGLSLRPQVEVSDGETRVTLGEPEPCDRVFNWWLEGPGGRVALSSQGATEIGGHYVAGKAFRGDRVKEYALVVEVLEPVESKVFEFDFRGVALP